MFFLLFFLWRCGGTRLRVVPSARTAVKK